MKLKITYPVVGLILALLSSCNEEHVYYNTAAKAEITAASEYEVGVPVSFTDSSVPTPGTTITSYYWEFGDVDNSTSTEKNPTFTYKKDGTYNVKLTVTDSNDLKSTSQHKIVVINPTKADFYLDKDEYYIGDEVKFFDASTTKGSTTITSYKWEFADANLSTSTEKNPSFKYEMEGSYPVKLTITDSYGLQASITKSVSIQDPSKIIATMWTTAIGGAVKGGSSPAMSPDGSTVYMIRSLVGEDVAALYALNSSDGQVKWALDISEAMSSVSPTAQAKDVFSSPSVGNDGTIYMVVRDLQSTSSQRGVYVIAVNPNGKVKYAYKGGVSGTNLYAVTPAIDSNGNVYVATRGNEVWKLNSNGECSVIANEGIGTTGGLTISKDGMLYGAANGINGLYSINTTNGNRNWVYNTDFGSAADAFTGALRSAQASIDADGTIYFVSDTEIGGMIIALTPSGAAKWIYNTIGAIPDGGVIIDQEGNLYANGGTAASQGLIALNNDGSLKWTMPTKNKVQTSPVIDNRGYIHVVDASANYYIVKSDGVLVAEAQLGQSCISAPVMDENGRLYVVIMKDEMPTMVCLTSKASSYNKEARWAMRGQNPQRTGLQK